MKFVQNNHPTILVYLALLFYLAPESTYFTVRHFLKVCICMSFKNRIQSSKKTHDVLHGVLWRCSGTGIESRIFAAMELSSSSESVTGEEFWPAWFWRKNWEFGGIFSLLASELLTELVLFSAAWIFGPCNKSARFPWHLALFIRCFWPNFLTKFDLFPWLNNPANSTFKDFCFNDKRPSPIDSRFCFVTAQNFSNCFWVLSSFLFLFSFRLALFSI